MRRDGPGRPVPGCKSDIRVGFYDSDRVCVQQRAVATTPIVSSGILRCRSQLGHPAWGWRSEFPGLARLESIFENWGNESGRRAAIGWNGDLKNLNQLTLGRSRFTIFFR